MCVCNTFAISNLEFVRQNRKTSNKNRKQIDTSFFSSGVRVGSSAAPRPRCDDVPLRSSASREYSARTSSHSLATTRFISSQIYTNLEYTLRLNLSITFGRGAITFYVLKIQKINHRTARPARIVIRLNRIYVLRVSGFARSV